MRNSDERAFFFFPAGLKPRIGFVFSWASGTLAKHLPSSMIHCNPWWPCWMPDVLLWLLRLGGMELVNGGDLDAALGLLNGPGVDANGALAHRTTLCNETQILWSLLVTFKAFLGISRCSNFKDFEAQGSILFIIIGPGCGQWWEDRPKDVADIRQPHLIQMFEIYQHKKKSLDHFWYFHFQIFQAKLQRLQAPNGLFHSQQLLKSAEFQGEIQLPPGVEPGTKVGPLGFTIYNPENCCGMEQFMEPKNPEAQPFWDCNVNVMGVPSYINWLVQHEQKLQENGVTGMSGSLAANARICAATR